MSSGKKDQRVGPILRFSIKILFTRRNKSVQLFSDSFAQMCEKKIAVTFYIMRFFFFYAIFFFENLWKTFLFLFRKIF